MKRGLTILAIAIILVSLGISVMTKKSFTSVFTNDLMLDQAKMVHINDQAPYNEKKQLLNADIIIEAEPIGEQKHYYQATQCTLSIKKVYQGDVTIGEEIDFYESGFFMTNHESIGFYNISYFNFMQPGKTYIVFANKKEYDPRYEERLERKVYTFASMEVSWFLKEMTEPTLLSKNEEYHYGDVKRLEFFAYSIEQRNAINQYKQQLLSKLKEKE